ncbi:LacI family DNA-binding transcriptional regulator [Leuconostoc mesenteroides]|uniref:LacI family DNA-binding transcriptional regulator n=1 Tax=Leuconostoc mesenteroides TaxID=1245 RepID=UPI0030CFF301
MVTIKQIALETDVSSSTVSRVLNNDLTLSVSDETRRKIIDAAQRLNYTKKHKKSISKKLIHIAVLTVFSEIREASDAYWRQIYLSIEQNAQEQNIIVDEIIRINQGINIADFATYDAIIILGDMTQKAVNQLQKINERIVLVDAKTRYETIDSVNPELRLMTTRILDEFYQAGRRHIGFIGGVNDLLELDGSSTLAVEDVRSEIYRNWAEEHQMSPHFYTGPWHAETGMQGAISLLREEHSIDALLVASDPIAIGAINALKSENLEPGIDIDVVSFDNVELSSYLVPALTTVDLNPAALGKTALEQAYELANDERDWTVWATIPGNLKYRETFKK